MAMKCAMRMSCNYLSHFWNVNNISEKIITNKLKIKEDKLLCAVYCIWLNFLSNKKYHSDPIDIYLWRVGPNIDSLYIQDVYCYAFYAYSLVFLFGKTLFYSIHNASWLYLSCRRFYLPNTFQLFPFWSLLLGCSMLSVWRLYTIFFDSRFLILLKICIFFSLLPFINPLELTLTSFRSLSSMCPCVSILFLFIHSRSHFDHLWFSFQRCLYVSCLMYKNKIYAFCRSNKR